MTQDPPFRESVVSALARIEQKLDDACKHSDGMHRTLYGDNGSGGIVHEIAQLKFRQGLWNKGLLAAQAMLAIIAGIAWKTFK